MAYSLAGRAEDDLDDIWVYVARESQSLDTATRLTESISRRFLLLEEYPLAGRNRDHDLGLGVRTLGVGAYIIAYFCADGDVIILRVVHGSRQLEPLFSRH